MGIIKEGFEAIDKVTGWFGVSLGDSSPYPAGSANTEKAVWINAVELIPNPMNVKHAESLLPEADRIIAIAQEKVRTGDGNKKVNQTYEMIYKERKAYLQAYIASGGKTPPPAGPALRVGATAPETGAGDILGTLGQLFGGGGNTASYVAGANSSTPPGQKSNNALIVVIVVAVLLLGGFFLLGKKLIRRKY